MSAHKSRVFHALQLASHKLHKIADRELGADSALTVAQAAALSVLRKEVDAGGKGATQKQVALALGQNESAVTAMVSRLVTMGYITRSRSLHDARTWELVLTSEGRTALDATRGPFTKVNKLIDSTLSREEVRLLADMLARLSAACDGVELQAD